MDSLPVRLVAGAIIPSVATIVFNLFNFFFDNYQARPFPVASASTYDIAPGCVFSMIGICVAIKDRAMESKLMVTSILLILFLLAGDFLVPPFLLIDRGYMIGIVDMVAFSVLCWAIREAG